MSLFAFTRPVDESEEEQAILKLADLCCVPPQCFPGSNPVLFEPKHVSLVKEEIYHVSGVDNLSMRFVMLLSQHNGKTRIYMIGADMRVNLLRFGRFPFTMFKGSAFECELHEKTDGGATVVLQDCLSLAGRDMSQSNFSYRKGVMQNVIQAYKESNKTLLSDQLQLELKYTTCLFRGELINADVKRLIKANDTIVYKSSNNKHRYSSSDNSLLYLNTLPLKAVSLMLRHGGVPEYNSVTNPSTWATIFSRSTKNDREISDSDIKDWETVVQSVTGAAA